MDNTNTIQSLTEDILNEVNSTEKTAAPKQANLTTELGQALQKTAEELRKYAESDPEISYADFKSFTDRMGGLS